MTAPLLSLILQSRDISSEVIGANSAMMPVGILLFSPFIPLLTRRFGSRQVALVAAIATAVLIFSYKLFDHLGVWFVLRLFTGMTVSTLFVLSEAWIVSSAGTENRGKIVAIYSSILAASFAAGPALIGVLGIEGWTPFIIGTLAIALGVIPVTMIREDSAVRQDSGSGAAEEAKFSDIFSFATKAPVLITAVGCFALFDAATLNMLPVYGVQNGLSQSAAAFALTALVAGNIVLQFPIGYLADRFPARSVLIGCAAVTAVLLAVLPWLLGSFWQWPLLLLAGSTGYGVYTVSLKSLGDRFDGHELISGSSAFALMWGLGALVGSLSSGWSIAVSTRYGLPMLLVFVYAILIAGLWWRQSTTGNDS